MKPQLSVLLTVFFFSSLVLSAQKTTTRGKEFFVSFFSNAGQILPDTTIVFMTSSVNTTGNITNPNTGFNKAFTITAGQVTQVPIPLAQAYNSVYGTVNNLGMQIIAADTISAYALASEAYSSDATCIIQKDALGTDYIIASYNGNRSSFLIEATENNTIVKITPSSTTASGNAAGVPFNITLNKGQTYLTAGYGDLSGSIVSVTNGCKPIAVFAGNQLSNVPIGYAYGDLLYEQLFPTNNWGKQFITATLRGRNVYRARVYAAYNNTKISIDGSLVSTINAGGFYEFQSANQPKYITTNNPVQVMIFAASINYDNLYGPTNNGDPTMITVPPLEQKLTESVFLSPVTIGSISLHKLSIVCKTADAPNTILDGANIGSSFTVVTGNPLYSHAALDVVAGQHKVANSNGFIAYAYGFGYEQGYGYCTGSSVENINTYFTCNEIPSIGNPTIDVCPGANIFNVITSGTNTSYNWDFGDGSTAIVAGSVLQQTHSYNTPGTYVVTLTTTSPTSTLCTPNIISQITVHVASSLAPAVSLISSPSSPFCKGSTVSFIATATNGGTVPAYQWKLNGTNVGSNSPTYVDSTFAEGDIISCTLTSSLTCATVATVTASLTVHLNSQVVAAVKISTPTSTVCSGNTATFTAVPIIGSSSPYYQWKVNGFNVGTNSATYSYIPKNGDIVTCNLTITNGCAAVNNALSNAITITVTPQIGSAVASVLVSTPKNPICAGSTTIFTATPTTGGAAPVYQWKLNGVNVGTNSPTYTNSATLKNNDTVYCIMTSNASCVITPTVTSNKIILLVNPIVTPTIVINASKTNICQGDAATFTASTTNAGTLPAYQWSLNGNNTGSNSATYSNSSLANGDVVLCTLTSSVDCAINPTIANPISMIVNPIIHPTINIAASQNPVCQKEQVLFSSNITNSGNAPTYVWSINGNPINNNSSTFSTASLANGDIISCKLVSNVACTLDTFSQSINMTIYTLPTVSFTPNETVILYGNTYQLNPTITGNISTYSWTPTTALTDPTIEKPVTNTLQNQTYNLAVTTTNNCTANANMKIIVFRDLVMPTAFTPNGDGNNDVFGIPAIYQSLTIQYLIIYDRWGKKFFETTDINKKWDGTINGAIQPSGTYIWTIKYENPFTKQAKAINGTVMLIR